MGEEMVSEMCGKRAITENFGVLKTTSPDKSGMASGDGGNDYPEVIFDSHDPSHRQ